jgi:hypothetical protein
MTVETIKTGYTIAENARLLRRFASLERRLLRILAGWLPEIPEWEVKKAVARHIWDSAQHAAWLRSRLIELRGGRADADAEPGFVRVLEEALHAPNTAALIAGLYLEIKQNYLHALRHYCQTTSQVVDAPTAEILERIALVEERHLQWAKTTYDGLISAPEVRREAETWRSYIASLIESTGGFHLLRLQAAPAPAVPEVYTPFRRSMKAHRDGRFQVSPAFEVYKEQKEMNQETFEESVITNFKIYATEMWAAELVASCLFDAPADLPWDFFYDLAHQCWDEARHAEMGEVRLAELGISLSDFPTAVSEYERGVRMPMLHRFCDLTIMAEAEHIHVRRPRMEKYLDNGDLRSAEFVDYDWSDEINHVRYGFKWVKYLLEEDARSLEDLKAEVWEMRHQLAKENPAFTLPPYFKMDN